MNNNKILQITDELIGLGNDRTRRFSTKDDITKYITDLLDKNGFQYNWEPARSPLISLRFDKEMSGILLMVEAEENHILYRAFYPFNIPKEMLTATSEAVKTINRDSDNAVILLNMQYGDISVRNEYHFEEPNLFQENSFWKNMKTALDFTITHFQYLSDLASGKINANT